MFLAGEPSLQAYFLVLSDSRALSYSTYCPQTQGPPASACVGIEGVCYHVQAPIPLFNIMVVLGIGSRIFSMLGMLNYRFSPVYFKKYTLVF